MLSDLSGGVNLACDKTKRKWKAAATPKQKQEKRPMLGKKEGRKGPKEVDCSLPQGKLDRSILFRIG